jgi:hypothetical protein
MSATHDRSILLSTDGLLIVYYLGLGFVALLGWVAIAQDLSKPFDEPRRESWNRASAILAIAGLTHPALPFIARDIARQAARGDEGESDRPTSPFVTLATASAAVSIAVAAAVIAVTTNSA